MGYIIPCKVCGDDHEDTEGDATCVDCRTLTSPVVSGSVGVERLVDAREGSDSSAQTASQLGSLIARAARNHKLSGEECPFCGQGNFDRDGMIEHLRYNCD